MQRNSTVIAVMARALDRPQLVKTRLAASIPHASARADLYAAFLADTLATCRRVPGVQLRLASTAPLGSSRASSRDEAQRFKAFDVVSQEMVPQRGKDLGARERNLFVDLFASGFSNVLIVGSDLPTLPGSHVEIAVDRMVPGRVVLGPSDDGGYYLIGLADDGSGKPPDLFTGIRWSTPNALSDTVEAARVAGLEVDLLPAWYDVDDEVGLARLCAQLVMPDVRSRAPATTAALHQLGLL